MRLCYVENCWAYFTSRPLTGPRKQWGDDWDGIPYEHNAGPPYNDPGANIVKIAFDGDLDRPSGHSPNSPYSVNQINAGAVAWLQTPDWAKEIIVIPAGVDFVTFVRLVQKAGGRVYFPITNVNT